MINSESVSICPHCSANLIFAKDNMSEKEIVKAKEIVKDEITHIRDELREKITPKYQVKVPIIISDPGPIPPAGILYGVKVLYRHISDNRAKRQAVKKLGLLHEQLLVNKIYFYDELSLIKDTISEIGNI